MPVFTPGERGIDDGLGRVAARRAASLGHASA
jgi:hypothetical protein